MLVRGTVLVLLLALLPAASAVTVGVNNPDGPAATTLYMHITDEINDFPLSTVQPTGLVGPDGAELSTTHSLCLEAGDAVTTLGSKQFHTYYGYTTVDALDGDDMGILGERPLIRGLAADFDLDAAGATLHFFLANNAGTVDRPTLVPRVVVEATVRAGSSISIDDVSYNQGRLLMYGQSEPANLAGEATTGATFESVGGREVYGFAVPLQVQASNVTAAEGFNVRLDVYVENPLCDAPDARAMPDVVVPFLDESHLSRLELSTLQPLRILSVSPNFLQHGVAITMLVQSPWGAYDVDGASANITITGPDAAPTVYLGELGEADGDKPRSLTFFWPNEEDGARGGLYAVTVEIANLQGTAKANATAAFDLRDGTIYPALADEAPLDVTGAPRMESPGLTLLLVLAAVAMALKGAGRRS